MNKNAIAEKMVSTRYVKDVGDRFILTSVYPEVVGLSMDRNTGEIDSEKWKK